MLNFSVSFQIDHCARRLKFDAQDLNDIPLPDPSSAFPCLPTVGGTPPSLWDGTRWPMGREGHSPATRPRLPGWTDCSTQRSGSQSGTWALHQRIGYPISHEFIRLALSQAHHREIWIPITFQILEFFRLLRAPQPTTQPVPSTSFTNRALATLEKYFLFHSNIKLTNNRNNQPPWCEDRHRRDARLAAAADRKRPTGLTGIRAQSIFTNSDRSESADDTSHLICTKTVMISHETILTAAPCRPSFTPLGSKRLSSLASTSGSRLIGTPASHTRLRTQLVVTILHIVLVESFTVERTINLAASRLRACLVRGCAQPRLRG